MLARDGEHDACRVLGPRGRGPVPEMAVRQVVNVRHASGPRNDACDCLFAVEEHALERLGVLGSVGVLCDIPK